MPLYRFDCADRHEQPDSVGTVCPDDKAAHLEALKFAENLMRNSLGEMRSSKSWRVDVSSDRGVQLFSVLVSAITHRGGRRL